MRSLYSCVAHEHDLVLVGVAALICVSGVYATFSLGAHARSSLNLRERRLWGAAGVISAACAVWATHFIAMLAFHPGAPVGFNPVLTAGSLLVALVVIGAGLVAVVEASSARGRAAAGALVGIGVSAMHYLGMAAYEVPGEVRWDGLAVLWSVAASLVLSAGAALAYGAARPLLRRLAPPLFVLAVCALHFIGMTAVTVVYDPGRTLGADVVRPEALSLAVAGAAALVLGLATAGLWLDQRSKRRQRAEEARLRGLADVALEGLLICRDETVVAANESVKRLYGSSDAPLVGVRVDALIDGKTAGTISENAEEDATFRAPEGPIPVKVLRRSLVLNDKAHTVIAVRDQRERIRTEAQIRSLAFTDPLTGLSNRAQFQAELDAHARSRRGRDRGFALMMIDLDRFKTVNDTLGHAVGDLLLQRAARRLEAAVRDGDVVARLGGDEFAILQPSVADPGDARVLAARVVDLLARPFLLNGNVVNIGASVGVALAPADGEEPQALLRNADLALYKAKAEGRCAFRMFEPGLDARMQARRALELDMRRAVAREEFEVHYQPLVDAKSGRVTGAEALVRWRDAQRGLVSPAEFIPLAEETGMISAIGRWVLRTACAEAATWPEGLTVAVNLSPVQFRDTRLADVVKTVLSETGLDPRRLELEITEGVLIADEERTLATLVALRECGVRISMDDFGTGYSSLSYLRRFPFDKIKIDQSFIRQVPENLESAAIVRAIITLGACLGMSTTVEGVETAEQLAFTTAEGCDHVQGYLLSRPLTADSFIEFLRLREAA